MRPLQLYIKWKTLTRKKSNCFPMLRSKSIVIECFNNNITYCDIAEEEKNFTYCTVIIYYICLNAKLHEGSFSTVCITILNKLLFRSII